MNSASHASKALAAGLALGMMAWAPVHAAEGKSGWSYEGDIGPENWGRLSPDHEACATGAQQSPVDLTGAVEAYAAIPSVHWRTMPLRVRNNGHTLDVMAAPGSFMMLGTVLYELVQFHFHTPSEHVLEGQAFPMEIHFVHRSEAGDLAVIGVFVMEGAANTALEPIWALMPKEPGEATSATLIRPTDLLPGDGALHRYAGSLTTPPCSEIVTWSVYLEPIEASGAQIAAFSRVFGANARPIQAPNRRFLLRGD